MNFSKESDLDLRILAIVVNNLNHAMDFSKSITSDLFNDDIYNLAELVISFCKTFKTTPAEYTLIDYAGNNSNLHNDIKNFWQSSQFKACTQSAEYATQYNFWLDKLKKRYSDRILGGKSVQDYKTNLQKVERFNSEKTFTQKTLKEDLGDFRSELKAKRDNPEIGEGIKTNYKLIDSVTTGLRTQELIIVSGETGAGKSVLLQNLATQMWLQENKITTHKDDFVKGYNAIYFSLEMPFDRIRARFFARLCNIPIKNILLGQFSQDQQDRLDMGMEFIANYPYEFQIVDMARGCTIDSIESRLREFKSQFDTKIMVVDYLNLIGSDSEESDWLKQSENSALVHELTRVHDVCGITAVQLTSVNPTKRSKDDTYNSENDAGIHRIGRSRAITHHANIVIQILKRKDEKFYSNMLYQFIKNRDAENDIKGSMKRDFAKATLLDIPQTEEQISSGNNETGDISKLLQNAVAIKQTPRQEAAANVIKNIEQKNAKRLTPQEELEEEQSNEEFA